MKGLTLYRVSQKSAEAFGHSSRFYVPHNLYHAIADPDLTPTIHQVLALSHITNYRLSDWLMVFGFDLDLISALRLSIPRQPTTLLDSTVYDMHAWVPWIVERQPGLLVPPIAPLGQPLAPAAPMRASDLLGANKGRFLYGRIGETDLCALPHFVPGSIVRVDSHRKDPLLESKTRGEKSFFLVEHESGWNCSQLRWLAKDRVLLHSLQNPYAELELQVGREARILGIIDAEIRPIRNPPRPTVPSDPVIPQNARLIPASTEEKDLKTLLRTSRMKVGFCFRKASSVSRWIANTQSDELYFAAPSTLSDYEAFAEPPRHIQKILTLCLLYCIDFREFLRASGLPLGREGHDAMPDELAHRHVPNYRHRANVASEQGNPQECSGFLSSLLECWGEIPLFLRYSLEELTGLKNCSLSDLFWVGGDTLALHPSLINATLVAVNRRVKSPAPSRRSPSCIKPLYVILKRDGSYLCGPCALHQGDLIVESHPRGSIGGRRFRNGVDAEIVGQVTAILRRLG